MLPRGPRCDDAAARGDRPLRASTFFSLLLLTSSPLRRSRDAALSSPRGGSYDEWRNDYHEDAGTPTRRAYFFFNVTNRAAVMGGSTPIVERVGPYAYKTFGQKFGVEYEDGGKKVKYVSQSTYEWDSEESGSGLSPDDRVVAFYPFYSGVVMQAGSESNLVLGVTNSFLNGVFAQAAAAAGAPETAIWAAWGSQANSLQGLDFPSLTGGRELSPAQSAVVLNGTIGFLPSAEGIGAVLQLDAETLASYYRAQGQDMNNDLTLVQAIKTYATQLMTYVGRSYMPESVLGGTQGSNLITDHSVHEWLFEFSDPLLTALGQPAQVAEAAHLQTSTPRDQDPETLINSGEFTGLYTGKGDIEMVSSYYLWNGIDAVPFPGGSRTVSGYTGTQFPPDMPLNDKDKADDLPVFISNIGRSVVTEHVDNTVEKPFDLDVREYRLKDGELSRNPGLNQPVDGIIDISGFSSGLPIALSQPYFYNGNRSLASIAVDTTGSPISADKKRDDTYLLVEPITGAVMEAHERLQINVFVDGSLYDYYSPSIKSGYYPIVVVDRYGRIEEDDADSFKSKIYGTQNLAKYYLFWGGIGAGVLLIVLGIFGIIFALSAKKPKQENTFNQLEMDNM